MLSATPQNTPLMFLRGRGRGNKIAYLPKAVFSELKATNSPRDALLLPSEWIFTLGTQLAFGLNGRLLPLINSVGAQPKEGEESKLPLPAPSGGKARNRSKGLAGRRPLLIARGALSAKGEQLFFCFSNVVFLCS